MKSKYEGLTNCAFIIIAMYGIRYIIEAYQSNLIHIPRIDISKAESLYIMYNVLLALSLSIINYYAARRHWRFMAFLLLPFIITNHTINKQMSSFTVRLLSFAYFANIVLKNISYNIENKPCNLTDYLCFLLAPSQCFGNNEKTKNKRCIKTLLSSLVIMIAFGFAFFCVKNNCLDLILIRMTKEDGLSFISTYITFALSVFFCWICFFFFIFKGYLMFIAVILQTDDILFSDWWNSTSMQEFWRKWNVPFHEFAKKYIYNRFKVYGIFYSRLLCFLFSAILHEYGMYLTLGRFGGYMFVAMLGQAFMCFELGNVFFWIIFSFLGQPVVLYLYYRVLYGDVFVTGIIGRCIKRWTLL